ncbi:MAG: fumarylacetoacetate hydrolase family protein [Pseudomonadales bacterium]
MLKTVSFQDQLIAPSKIVCVGRNYVAHIEELGNEIPDSMVVFVKPNSSISDTLQSFADEPLHYEAELAFLVKDGDIQAVGFGLDLTKRKLQSALKAKGLPWERAKAFDGAALFSEFVEFSGGIGSLSLELRVNDVVVQQGGVELMMYPPDKILLEVRQFMTLNDGDILMTGTPAGVGQIQAGSVFEGAVLWKDQRLLSARWDALAPQLNPTSPIQADAHAP